jgi:hypothetical protein
MSLNRRPTVADLSPAAQAVLDAVIEISPAPALSITAALRAAADQVVPDEITWQSPSEERRHWPSGAERAGEQNMACVVRRKLLALAAELEAT